MDVVGSSSSVRWKCAPSLSRTLPLPPPSWSSKVPHSYSSPNGQPSLSRFASLQSIASIFFSPLLLLFLCLLLIGFSCLIYTIVCRIPISLFLPRVICPVKLAIPDGLVLLDTNCIHTHTPNRLDRDDQETRMDSERDCGIWLWAYRIFLFSLLLDHGCSIPEESASAGLD